MMTRRKGLPAALSAANTELLRVEDPLMRARDAGSALEQLSQSMIATAEIRRQAVTELVNRGMSYAAIGQALGVTKSMVAKIHSETIRRMLGEGPEDLVGDMSADVRNRLGGGLRLPDQS